MVGQSSSRTKRARKKEKGRSSAMWESFSEREKGKRRSPEDHDVSRIPWKGGIADSTMWRGQFDPGGKKRERRSPILKRWDGKGEGPRSWRLRKKEKGDSGEKKKRERD